MSSIASGMNQERTNRWLLIGAAVLAVAAGVLVFLLLANVGGDDEGGGAISDGDVPVLVANQTIDANTVITEEMLTARSVAEEGAVANHASETSQVVGRVTTSPIIEGQQVSLAQIGGTETESVTEDGLAVVLKPGRVGFALSASEIKNVAGFVQAGDHVNVVAVFAIDDDLDGVPGGGGINDRPYTRVETLLQNVEVLAVAQEPVDAAPVPDTSTAEGEGTTTDDPTVDTGTDPVRPDEVEPNPGAASVTVDLSLEEVHLLAAARVEGELFLSLRALGDEAAQPVETLCFDKFGRLPCPVVAR